MDGGNGRRSEGGMKHLRERTARRTAFQKPRRTAFQKPVGIGACCDSCSEGKTCESACGGAASRKRAMVGGMFCDLDAGNCRIPIYPKVWNTWLVWLAFDVAGSQKDRETFVREFVEAYCDHELGGNADHIRVYDLTYYDGGDSLDPESNDLARVNWDKLNEVTQGSPLAKSRQQCDVLPVNTSPAGALVVQFVPRTGAVDGPWPTYRAVNFASTLALGWAERCARPANVFVDRVYVGRKRDKQGDPPPAEPEWYEPDDSKNIGGSKFFPDLVKSAKWLVLGIGGIWAASKVLDASKEARAWAK